MNDQLLEEWIKAAESYGDRTGLVWPFRLADNVRNLSNRVEELEQIANELAIHTCDLPFDDCREVKKFRRKLSELEIK